MKIITEMSPADHKKTGYELYILREQMILLIAPQFKYAINRRNRKMYGRLTGLLNRVVFALDDVRSFLNTVAARELEGDLDFLFYYPGSQGIEIPDQLMGIPTKRANSFHQNSMRRDQLETESDGRRRVGIDIEDGNTLFSFFMSGVRNALGALSHGSKRWPDKEKAVQLRALCEKTRSAAYALAISLQDLRKGGEE